MAEYVAAIDQGTTSSRLILFDKDGRIQNVDQREHEQITPKAGWVEHDATEVWRRTREIPGVRDQRRFDVTRDPLGTTRPRVSVIISRPIRLREGAAPIRRVLIFDDHPATIRLLDDVARAQKRENKLARVKFTALIVLLLLAMSWRLL